MNKIIYIHHDYNNDLFYKLFHNVDSVTKIDYCNYEIHFGSQHFSVSFGESLDKNNTDVFHILDVSILYNTKHKYNYIDAFSDINNYCSGDGAGWIILLMIGEKVIDSESSKVFTDFLVEDINNILLTKPNATIINDNYFLNKELHSTHYKNHIFCLSNILFEWNYHHLLNLFYDFGKFYEKLNFDFDVSLSIRKHTPYRIELINKLAQLENPKIFLSRSSQLLNKTNLVVNDTPFIKIIDSISKNDFDKKFINGNSIHIYKLVLEDICEIFLKAKLTIVTETIDWYCAEINSMYLSEKILKPIVANMPFISTHSYPTKILSEILDIPEHPFQSNFEYHKANPTLFTEFLIEFLNNFDYNLQLCKDWSNLAHSKLMDIANTKNNLLDYLNKINPNYKYYSKKML